MDLVQSKYVNHIFAEDNIKTISIYVGNGFKSVDIEHIKTKIIAKLAASPNRTNGN